MKRTLKEGAWNSNTRGWRDELVGMDGLKILEVTRLDGVSINRALYTIVAHENEIRWEGNEESRPRDGVIVLFGVRADSTTSRLIRKVVEIVAAALIGGLITVLIARAFAPPKPTFPETFFYRYLDRNGNATGGKAMAWHRLAPSLWVEVAPNDDVWSYIEEERGERVNGTIGMRVRRHAGGTMRDGDDGGMELFFPRRDQRSRYVYSRDTPDSEWRRIGTLDDAGTDGI